MTDTDEPKFTPGPWEADKGGARIVSSDGKRIARCLSVRPGYEYQIAHNRHLITAAPDLYEALLMVAEADEDCHADRRQTIPLMERAIIDRALAKARGEEG